MSIYDDFALFEREHGHPVPPWGESCPSDCQYQPVDIGKEQRDE